MSKVKQTGETHVTSAYGNPVDIKVGFEWDEFGPDSTIEEVNQEVSPKDMIELVNTRNKNNARSAAIAKATASYKPDPNSPEEIRKRMIADAMKGNKKLTEESAAALVDSLLGA